MEVGFYRKQNQSFFLFFFFFCMNPDCAVGLCQALTADDHYFQPPPAEQFISLSSTRTALLLNNARWRKTLEARCSDAQPCIHEEPIAAAAILFIQPLRVFMFYTPCRISRRLSRQWLSLRVTAAPSLQWIMAHFCSLRVFPCLFAPICKFLLRGGWFTSSFVRMKRHICQSLRGKLEVTALCLLFHFSLQCHTVEQWKRSDKQRSSSIVCSVLAVCNYTLLFWAMSLQWVLWGATIWPVLHFLLFVIFVRVCNHKCRILIS